MEILYLSTTTPKFGAVEFIWKDAKNGRVTSQHYEVLEEPDAYSVLIFQDVLKSSIYKFLYRYV